MNQPLYIVSHPFAAPAKFYVRIGRMNINQSCLHCGLGGEDPIRCRSPSEESVAMGKGDSGKYRANHAGALVQSDLISESQRSASRKLRQNSTSFHYAIGESMVRFHRSRIFGLTEIHELQHRHCRQTPWPWRHHCGIAQCTKLQRFSHGSRSVHSDVGE